jgi:hypothetical protein
MCGTHYPGRLHELFTDRLRSRHEFDNLSLVGLMRFKTMQALSVAPPPPDPILACYKV